MRYYPGNTVAHYVTKLSERILLDGEYEVGLAEIIYPHSWFNVDNRDKKYWFAFTLVGTMFVKNYLPSGYYNSAEDFVRELTEQAQEAFSNQVDFSVQFVYDNKTNKIRIQVTSRHNVDGVTLSPELKRFLGFDGDWSVTKEPNRIADRVFELNGGVSLIYVYCDIAGYTIVGDTKAPLLRVCNVKGKHGDIVRITYDQPHYVPLSRRDFDTVEIHINNELGQPMPFEFGKSVVTLHFQRRHEKALLLRR
ncbi:MAG TPA: hypothetical protein VLS45_07330 [Methylomicrobium sp.]|nr:hypothetical protein [Methylomicrobium sp.]